MVLLIKEYEKRKNNTVRLGDIMLRIIVSVSWLITVVFMWLPNECKNQFMKDNERQIIKILATISAVLSVCYSFLV